jgi:NADH-quinone oxidoreductase subunit H
VLFILATLSLAVYGVVIGGWASNNKDSFLGGLRATANMISYEVPLGLAILTIVVMFGTLDLGEIVDKQASYWLGLIPAWNVFTQPLAFLMFLVCIHAEANRAPFDTAEAEQELVGGYHTEYSSMRFALFFLAEYAGMITTSAVCVCLFFGGWHLPGLNGTIDPAHPSVTDSMIICLIRAVVLFTKTLIVIGVFMWVRWSLPRFRFDQIMDLAWRALIPISLSQFVVTVLVIWFFRGTERAYMRLPGRMALALLVANVVLLAVTMVISTLIPAGPDTNRKIKIPGSRFEKTPLPAGVGAGA